MGYRGWRFWDAVTFGRRRRRRALDRSLADLEVELNALPFRPVGISARTPRRLNHRLRNVLIALLVVAGLALAWELRTPDTGLGQNPAADRPWPGAPDDQQADPIGTPPQPPPGKGGYTFTRVKPNGDPVAYDPCRPIHYVTSWDGEPDYGPYLVDLAVREVSFSTGLTFVDDGHTDEVWSTDRPSTQPDRYGSAWAPVLISWTDSEHAPKLAGSVAGLGGSTAVIPPGQDRNASHYVTGAVALDVEQFGEFVQRPRGMVQGLDVIEHELGHVVGLSHVNDPSQLMYREEDRLVRGYNQGDMRGLSSLGSGSCFPDG